MQFPDTSLKPVFDIALFEIANYSYSSIGRNRRYIFASPRSKTLLISHTPAAIANLESPVKLMVASTNAIHAVPIIKRTIEI